MKTSVVLHGDVLDHVEVERRPGTQEGGNCVRSGAKGGTHGARSDATRRATRKGSSAKAARTQGRRGASKGGTASRTSTEARSVQTPARRPGRSTR